jgi:Cdc6-like AAA superfamily ATPase
MMVPNGWLGLLNNACEEIEAALAPSKAVDVVEYFFAAVRDSRLRIFLQFSEELESEARSNAIKSLIIDVQANCHLLCNICGKEVALGNHYGIPRGALPDCGSHEDDETDDVEVVENSKPKEDVKSEVNLTLTTLLEGDEITEGSVIDTIIDEALDQDNTAHINLYDVSAIRAFNAEVSTRYRDKDDVTKVKAILSKLIKAGGDRILKPLPNHGIEFLDQLQENFPNFSKVVDMLRGINALSSNGEVPRIPAMLLLGPPGVGKTMFAEALANGMQVPFKIVRMENQQAGAGLVGSADFWSNSKPGAVFNVLTNGDCGNPVVVVDEVDKAANDNRYNPINGLYSLLEPGSASSFNDESLPDVSLDASKITWVLTANYKELIPEPILSRVRIFEIPSPDHNQAAQVAKRIYQMLLDESPSLKVRFNNELSADVTDLLASLSPRKVRLAIEIALGRAAMAKRNALRPEDVDAVEKVAKMKVGFM